MVAKENRGDETEDLVEKICTKMFFSDFTVRKPKYKKKDKKEKEAADLLIPFGEILLAIQVKSKTELSRVSEKTPIDFQRISQVIEDGVGQLKTIKRALANEGLTELKTVRGYSIPFACKQFRKLTGLVILDLIGEEIFPEDERTVISNGFLYKHDMPVHIYMRSDFEAISSEIDTLPDFVEYLETREIVHSRGLFWFPLHELDFLVLYKTKPEIVRRAIDNNTHIFLNDNLWEHYQDKLDSVIRKRNQLNQPSYLIDIAINELHKSVGFNLVTDVTNTVPAIFPQGSLEGYLVIAYELAMIPRLGRRLIGEKFLRCLKQANKKIGVGYSFVGLSRENKSGVLVVSTKSGRNERTKMLYNLSAAVYSAHDLDQIIGIATEPLTGYGRSFDFVILKGDKFDNHEELVDLFRKAFGPGHFADMAEYIETNEKGS